MINAFPAPPHQDGPSEDEYFYRAYGLGISSNFAIDEFRPANSPADVEIRRLAYGAPVEASSAQGFQRFDRKEILFVNAVDGVFRMSNGQRIEMWPTPTADPATLRFFTIGNLMAMLLYQRGLLVLHASCVDLDEGAGAFVGRSGAGKSSLAAAFDVRGHRILSDDVTAVDLEAKFMVPPGYPFFKIAPEAAASLGLDVEGLHFLHAREEEKRGCRMQNYEPERWRPLSAVFLIEAGEEDSITRIPASEGLISLIPHTFPTRMYQPGNAEHLNQLARLIRHVPIYRFMRRPGLEALPAHVRLVQQTMGAAG